MNRFCPDFFLLGAPKCGTTTIAQWLKEQDSLFLPSVKEPNYFNTDEKLFASHSEEQYRKLYAQARKLQLLGDATPWYLSSETAIRGIVQRNPEAKFIVLVRDHVELACAMHQQEFVSGNEDCEDFHTAWNLQSNREKGLGVPKKCYSVKRLLYTKACSIGHQLEFLMTHVDAENVLVIHVEALRDKPAIVKKSLANFLKFESIDRSTFAVVNSRKKWNSPVWITISRSVVLLKKRLGLNYSLGLITKFGQRKIQPANISDIVAHDIRTQFSKDKELLDKVLDTKIRAQYIR